MTHRTGSGFSKALRFFARTNFGARKFGVLCAYVASSGPFARITKRNGPFARIREKRPFARTERKR